MNATPNQTGSTIQPSELLDDHQSSYTEPSLSSLFSTPKQSAVPTSTTSTSREIDPDESEASPSAAFLFKTPTVVTDETEKQQTPTTSPASFAQLGDFDGDLAQDIRRSTRIQAKQEKEKQKRK